MLSNNFCLISFLINYNQQTGELNHIKLCFSHFSRLYQVAIKY